MDSTCECDNTNVSFRLIFKDNILCEITFNNVIRKKEKIRMYNYLSFQLDHITLIRELWHANNDPLIICDQ